MGRISRLAHVWGDWLVDGRNRWRACELAGVEPKIEHRSFDDESACGRWIIAVNKDRRHETPSQLAWVASDPEVLALYRAEAKERQGTRNDLKPDISAHMRGSAEGKSSRQAAQAFGVSSRSVDSGIAVRASGTPELQEAVESGRLAVSAAAEVAKLPEAEQSAARARATARRVVAGATFLPGGCFDYLPPAFNTRMNGRAQAASGR